MKNSKIILAIILTAILLLSGCGKASSIQPAATVTEPQTATPAPDQKETSSKIAEDAGYKVELVAAHPITGTDGKPYAALEIIFTNNNAEGASFATQTMRTVYQNNVECTASSMNPPDTYDWGTDMTNVKGGASTTVYIPIPLQNDSDPIEVEVSIMGADFSNMKTAKATFDLK